MSKKIVLAAILIIVAVGASIGYFLNTWHQVSFTDNFKIREKYTKMDYTEDPPEKEYWFRLEGHKDVEADSRNQWNNMQVGQYITITWSEWRTYVRTR